MEWRIAHREIEHLAGLDHALEARERRRLHPALDELADGAVAGDECPGPIERHGIDFRTDEAPAVLARANQRVDAVRPHPDVKHGDIAASRNRRVAAGP